MHALIDTDGLVLSYTDDERGFREEPGKTIVKLSDADYWRMRNNTHQGRWKFRNGQLEFLPDSANVEIVQAQARAKRDELLKRSDWTQLPDVPLATKEAWATYRQALRDITEQPGYPLNIVWPDHPKKT